VPKNESNYHFLKALILLISDIFNCLFLGSFRHSFRSSRHRCSLVVPLQIPCGECRVQIEPEGNEEEEEKRREEKRREENCGKDEEEEEEGEDGIGRATKSSAEEEKMDQDGNEDGTAESRKPSASGEFSVVRQNLLGPLSFDDLYYIT
jgi:hypothetical protein